jgi:hypothetical protein
MGIEYDGVRRNLNHLAPQQQAIVPSTARVYAEAGMRPLSLSVVVAGVDVTKLPELWPAAERNHGGPGRLEPTAAPHLSRLLQASSDEQPRFQIVAKQGPSLDSERENRDFIP